ncbi:MAG: endolytic transglycosylase MltG [Burkholderiales bacterium]
MRLLFSVVLALLLGTAGAAYLWLDQSFDLPGPTVDLAIEPGTSGRDIATAVSDAGVPVNASLLYAWFRVSGQSKQIRAGSYELDRQTTPRILLQKLVRGEEALRSVTLVEGWTFRQVREALAKAEQLKPESQAMAPADIMSQLGKPGIPAEGHFFPDTYTYSKGSSDLAVMRRAMRAMDKRLAAAWAVRDSSSPLKSPEDALVLASIVEKETGSPKDRANIASVFSNRLRIGMRLQTDPTVIYGLGATFDGNLRKKDLQADTPWNTYTRAGLPPTPIAMPGKASLLAAVQPASSKALYFVARGDGSSQFSNSLDEHNRAVNKYQRGQ